LFGFAFLRRDVDDQPRTSERQHVFEKAVKLARQLFVEPGELIVRLGEAKELGEALPRPTTIEFIAGVQLAQHLFTGQHCSSA